MKTSNRHKNENIVIGKTGLLVEQKLIQIENILTGNSFPEILLSKNVNEVDQQERVDSESLNVSLMDQTYTLYNLRQSSRKKIKC